MASRSNTVDKIRKGVERLPERAREELYNYLEYLEYRESHQRGKVTTWAELGGSLSPDEADELKRVIREGCENIDHNGW